VTDIQPPQITENIYLRKYGTLKNEDITSVCRYGKCNAPVPVVQSWITQGDCLGTITCKKKKSLYI
jgi:hypothetical protein